jgi:PEP-CTERM/exosortase A-associated glycosyltransferase
LKVLHVLDHSVPLFSGYSFRSRSIVDAQRSLGLQPVVLTSPKHGVSPSEVEEIGGVRHYRTRLLATDLFSRIPVAREAQLMVRLAQRIALVAQHEKVNLIHAHSPLLNGLPALWVGRRLGIPVVYEARAFWEDAAVDHRTCAEGDLRYRVSRKMETFVFTQADRVVTICENMRRELMERGIAREKILVMPNGVDSNYFIPQARAENLAARYQLNGNPVIGFIGSFYRYEGLDFLLAAMPELAKRVPDVRLLLVGGGQDEARLRDRARNLGRHVIFAGQVPHDEVKNYYSIMDIVVCPRHRMRLTDLVTPLKPLEAMAMGRMVLASDVGGHLELIRHDHTGILFKADDREDFLSHAAHACENRGRRTEIACAARRYVEAERNWRGLVSNYLPVYQAIARH